MRIRRQHGDFACIHAHALRWMRAVLFLLVLSTTAWAEQRVRVGIYENSPKVSISPSGKPEGIFIDLIEAIADKEGWELDYVHGTWSEGLARLESGKIDLMPDVALTPEREPLYAFHREPVLSSWNQIYARHASGIRSLLDLDGKRVAVLEGSSQQAFFTPMAAGFGLRVTLLPQPDFAAAFSAVATGRADAVVSNRFYGARHAVAAGLEDTAIIFNPSRLYFAAPKHGNTAVLTAIDRHLEMFKKDSTSVYYRSLRRWSDEELRPNTPAWLTGTALAAVALLLATVSWLVLLRREVAARTTEIRQRSEEVMVTNRLLRATGSSLDLQAVLDEATRGALALTGFDGGVLCIRDPETGRLHVGARANACAVTDRAAGGGPLCDATCPGILEGISEGKRHVVLPANTCDVAQACGNVRDDSVCWNAFFPLDLHGHTVGLLCLYSRRVEPPAVHTLELVEDICGPVALAMENARLYEQVQQHAHELEHRVDERTRELGEREAFVRALADEQKLVLENIQVGIAFTGDGRILRVNPKFAELFGYDEPAQLVGADPAMLFPDADEARRFLAAVRPKLAAGEAVDVEWAGARRDGSHFFGHTIARAISAPGYTLAAIWMVEDVTERKAAEREIAELTAFLQSTIDHIPNPIFYKSPDLRFLGCNHAYEEAFGVVRADIIGKSMLDLAFLPEADRHADQENQAQAIADGRTLQREAAILFADGRVHQTLFSVSGFHRADGSPGGLVGVIVDVTQLKQAEAALRAANEEQAAIFEAANFGIALIQERVIRRCNRRLEEIFGYAAGELAGQSTRIWYDSGEAYLLGCDPTHLQTARGEFHEREQQLRHKDGSLFWCRMMARTLDPADFSKGIVCVVEDVTEERAAAEALLEAKHAAEAADRLKSAFLATMSHELRTPLNSIIGFTGLVLQELPGPLNQEQKKQLGMVQGSARHLLALINDVLDISKIEAGEFRVAVEPFDLTASIARVADMVRPLAEKKGVALSVNVADGVGAMMGDARRVEQILLNLLGNAIKFTESGTVTLDAMPVAGFQPEAAVAPVPAVRLSVSDTGMGIKPEDMDLLFSPFRQIDSTLSRNHEGTGLGLAICHRLAALMGGIIEAESRWGEGSVFAVTLPMNPHAEREPS